MKGLLLALALAASAALSGWLVFQEARLEPISDGPRAELPAAVQRTRIVAPGRIEPYSEEIAVAAAITGRIDALKVDVGASVEEGQIIATLDNAEYSAAVKHAEAAVAIARASLEKLQNGARPAERDEAAAAIQEAEAVLALATAELNRQRGLVHRDLASRQDLDRAESEFAVAKARLARARNRYHLLIDPPRADDVARLEAELGLAQARLAEARAMLDKTLVRSPIKGQVLRRLRLPGEQVSAMLDTPVTIVGDTTRLRVRAEIDEADIGLIRQGQIAYAQSTAYGDQRFPGRVSEIGLLMGRKQLLSGKPSEHIDTGVLEVLVDLEPGVELPVGLRVDTYFELDQHTDR